MTISKAPDGSVSLTITLSPEEYAFAIACTGEGEGLNDFIAVAIRAMRGRFYLFSMLDDADSLFDDSDFEYLH